VTRLRRWFVAGAAALALTLPLGRQADASIVERIVAVVGERPILLSDLRHRARPFLARIYAGAQSPAQIAANETQMFKELLNRMIDDRLEEQAAEKARLSVSIEELDSAIKNIAAQAKLDPKELIAEAKRQGLSEQDYRDELRRQVLEGKLVQLRVRGRVKVSEEDGKAAFARFVKETGGSQVDVRILALRAAPTPAVQQARTLLAEDLVRRARAGEDFCKLVSDFSDDTQTKYSCGSHGVVPMENLVKEVQVAIKGLRVGEFTAPIDYAPDGRNVEATLIVQLHSAPKAPSYEDLHDQMMDKAFGEAIERQRKLWLQDLRRGVYVDVRL
jgi:peptidyl-prolyl cis-trans isomerase SurA